MKDKNGRSAHSKSSVLRATAKRRCAEEKLCESEEKYRVLFDIASVGFGIADINGNIIEANRKMAEITGYTIEELKLINVKTLYINPDERDSLLRALKEKGMLEDMEFKLKHKNNTTFSVMLNLHLIELDGVELVLTVARDITERKRVEEELQKRERLLASVFESIQDGIGVIDGDMNIIRVNPTAEKWYPNALPLAGKKCFEAYHGRNEPCEFCPARRTLRTGKSDYEIIAKHGPGGKNVGWVEIYSFPLIDTGTGLMNGVIEYVRDITERKLIEKDKERLLKAIDNSTDGITIADENDCYIYVNAAYAAIFGYSQKEFIGKTWRKITPPELIASIEKGLSRTMQNRDIGKFCGEVPGLRKDGTIIPIEVQGTAIWDEKGNYQGHICIVRDITERKKVEESLTLFSQCVENAPDGVQIVDLDGYIMYSNRAVEEIYGFTPEEFRGKHVNELNLDPEFAGEVILPGIKRSGRWVGELIVKHKYGKTVPIWLNASLVRNRKGEPIALMGIIRDITERKKVEEEIKKYARELEESNRMKELFTDIMAHDLLNPLNIARGYIDFIQENETSPRKISYIETIKRNLVKGLELIENTTLLSKLGNLERIEFIEIDIKDVIDRVVENLEPIVTEAGMTVENNIVQSVPCRGNKIIEEVFSNLISNALKYATEGKRVTIECMDEGDFWNIRIIDFGAGVKDSDKTAIFERFHRMEKKGVKGTGLGLAIAGKIMELHNGRIWVEDNPEGGAIFVVEMPKS